MKIMIGSKNPAKIQAVKQVFSKDDYFFEAIDVPSGVSDQPFSDEETIQGAVNRALQAKLIGSGNIGIGLEGGVTETEMGLFLCNWGALVSDDLDHPILAGGARILLPDEIAEKLRNGSELGPVMDDFTKKQNIREAEGAIGIFTNGLLHRTEMFSHITKMLSGQLEYFVKQKR